MESVEKLFQNPIQGHYKENIWTNQDKRNEPPNVVHCELVVRNRALVNGFFLLLLDKSIYEL